MSTFNYMHFEYSGFNIRITDLRPKSESIQINIYDPNNSGHSACFFTVTNNKTTKNLEEFKTIIIDNNILTDFVAKAMANFSTYSQVSEG